MRTDEIPTDDNAELFHCVQTPGLKGQTDADRERIDSHVQRLRAGGRIGPEGDGQFGWNLHRACARAITLLVKHPDVDS